jgi:hypothetical protein
MKKQARVLLPDVDVARDWEDDAGGGSTMDLSIYPLVVEELLSFGVTDFAVVRGTSLEKVVPKLPGFVRDRVRFIDASAVAENVARLFEPILNELEVCVKFSDLPLFGFGIESKSGTPVKGEVERLLMACGELYPELFRLVLGMKYELHVELNMSRMRGLMAFIQVRVRSADARLSLAVVRGILDSYQPQELSSVQLRSAAERTHVNIFEDLMKEPDYLSLSAESHALGFPGGAGEAAHRFGRAARQLLKTAGVRRMLEYAARWVETAFNIPEPAAELIDKITGQKYLPPVFSAQWVSVAAQKKWLELLPDPIPAVDIQRTVSWADAYVFDPEGNRYRKEVRLIRS